MIAEHPRFAVEPLSARVFRYRIARGYSIHELATSAHIFAGTIRRLEAGRSVDKRILAPLAAALGVPLCRLVCGEHSCSERACVPRWRREPASEPPRCTRWSPLRPLSPIVRTFLRVNSALPASSA